MIQIGLGHVQPRQNVAKRLFKQKRCVTQALQLWRPESIEADEKAIPCITADWVTRLTHPPSERKRTCTSFQGNVLFNLEAVAK